MSDNAPETTVSDNTLTAGFEPQQSAAPAVDNGQATQQSETWFGSYSQDFQDLLGKKGLSELSQQEATESLAKSYMNLESMRGVPDDQLFKITSDMGEDDWNKVYNAMGRPETVEGYTYQATETDSPELVDAFKSVAHELGLTENQVTKFIPAINEHIVSMVQGQEAQVQAANNEALTNLQKEWAGAWDKNLNIATRAAEHFGIDEDMQKAMVSTGNSAKMLQALNKIGSMMAEGDMIGMSPTDQRATIGAMSKAEAQDKLSKLQGDPDFAARLNSSDRKVSDEASKEMEKYYKILSS